jgi:hypothetical protein
MGSAQSTHTPTENNDNDLVVQQEFSTPSISVSGHQTSESSDVLEDEDDSGYDSDNDDSDSDSNTDEEDSEEEYDEEWNERLAILEDARKLRQLAEFFLQPEKPVAVDATAAARCYFDRPSAPKPEEEDSERDRILEDLKQLKKLAVDCLHPELPAETTDPFACGRNYYTRPSAPEWEDVSDMEDRDDIMEDMKRLKKLAQDYLRPERAIEVDPFCSYRNYFNRPSAPEQESLEECEEKAKILADAQQLKKLAVDYLHPEKHVKTTDPCACGRSYFSRPSAPTQEALEDVEERDRILEEMHQMKKFAVDYLHPEKPVETTDPFACGRNFFTRPSAPEYEDKETMEERDAVIEDMKALKNLAQDYLEPERPVEVNPLASCRNYFDRPSAPIQEGVEALEERNRVLEEMLQLKKLAIDYLLPEKPVKTTDPCACGRNYFTRPSAEEYEDEDERNLILEEMKQLKRLAVDYLHPEKPVEVTDPCATGRNYFDRPSAPGHVEQTHTYCEWVDHGFHHVIDHDHHFYWYNHSESNHQPFDMDDEEPHFEFKEVSYEAAPFKGEHAVDFVVKDDQFSRSPSSVLLLTWAPQAA